MKLNTRESRRGMQLRRDSPPSNQRRPQIMPNYARSEVEFMKSHVESYLREHGASDVTCSVEHDVPNACYVVRFFIPGDTNRVTARVACLYLQRDRQATLRRLERDIDGATSPRARRELAEFTQFFSVLGTEPWDVRIMPATNERQSSRARKSVETRQYSLWDHLMNDE